MFCASDVNEAFGNVCRLSCPGGMADETILRKVKVKVTLKTRLKLQHQVKQQPHQLTSGWDCLSLQYSAPWPLHLILTPSHVDTYNDVARMLLRVRRVQKLLQEAWFADVKDKSPAGRGAGTANQWQLRAHMLFVVNNLQVYHILFSFLAEY